MSVRVVLDLLDQVTNTRVLRLFHKRVWQSGYSEVNVNLVEHWLLVTLSVTCVTANNGCPRSTMICFVSNVEVCAFMWGTCLGGSLRVTYVTANNGCHHSIMICFVFNVEPLAVTRWTCLCGTLRVTCVTANNVSPFYHDLVLDLVGLIGNF